MYYGDAGLASVLTEANPPLADRSTLTVGMVLRIPDRDTALRTELSRAPSPASDTSNRRQQNRYHVTSGDTLYTIALNRLSDGSRWPEIYELNKDVIGEDAGLLRVGMVLKLPQK
jgi:nucleoid-associated protein YgaU